MLTKASPHKWDKHIVHIAQYHAEKCYTCCLWQALYSYMYIKMYPNAIDILILLRLSIQSILHRTATYRFQSLIKSTDILCPLTWSQFNLN